MRHCHPSHRDRSSSDETSSRSERHGRHGYGRSSRSSRVFEQGDLRQVMLALIAEKPSHGYELIKEIEDRLAGAYSPSPGLVYPTLTLLEELGYLTLAQGDGPKKAYTITEEGRAALERDKASVEAIFARIAEVAKRSGGGPDPRIVRALENLKLALRLRLERGKLTNTQVVDVAAALDAAAATVERE
ncbi:MAG: PadR family transcriptional regulator [Caulobacteraceae bacterium]